MPRRIRSAEPTSDDEDAIDLIRRRKPVEEQAVRRVKHPDTNQASNEEISQISFAEFKSYLVQYTDEERKLSYWEMHFVNLISAALQARDLRDSDLYAAYRYFVELFGERASRTAFRYHFAQHTA